MNERIKEIGRQAGFAFISDGVFGQRWYESKCGMDKAEFEKFAELIVRECMELTHWKDFDMSVEQRIRLSVYQDIKEHFGVEE